MEYYSTKPTHFSCPEDRAKYIAQMRHWNGCLLAARNKARRNQSARDICDFMHMLSSEDRVGEMLRLISHAPAKVVWPVFLEWWPCCDRTWEFNCVMPEILGRAGSANEYYDKDARDFFDSLPDEIIVYRGCRRDRVRGGAWTTDLKVAEGFARGHRGIHVPDPILATGLISRNDIFAVFVDRQESEILCYPELIETHSYYSSRN